METNRREFLRIIGSGALVMAAMPAMSACTGIVRSDLATPQEMGRGIPDLEQTEMAILTYASLAPSGHNMQPWFIRRIKPYEYVVGMDKTRRLPAVDPENRESLLSIGAFIENLCAAASFYGYAAHATVLATTAGDEDLANITLHKAATDAYPLSRITARRTVKKGQLSHELNSQDVKTLTAVCPEHIHYFPRGNHHTQCLADWTAEAYRSQTWRDDAQKELAACMRLKDHDIRQYRDGLTTAGMELGGLAGWYVRTLVSPADVMGKSFREQGIKAYTRMAQEGGGWMIITSAGGGVADLIETGRRFERMALMVRELGIALHPMTQILEEKQWRHQFTALHSPGVTPQFILRVGYLKHYPEPVSVRRPVAWFLRP